MCRHRPGLTLHSHGNGWCQHNDDRLHDHDRQTLADCCRLFDFRPGFECGQRLGDAKVELRGTGTNRSVTTNSFGNFTINEVQAGEIYVINVSAKKYTFAPQVISATDNISGLTFNAQRKKLYCGRS